MNRKPYIGILAFALVCLAAGFLTSCSSSSSTTTTPPAITVTLSTAPPSSLNTFQTASVAATVANDSANAGVTWSCAPAGSCGAFSASASASGASVTYTAPSAAASVTITATSVTNTSVSASGSVTVAQATTSNYVFYASGQDGLPAGSGNVNYYAIAGAVQLDASGNIYGGEQDYNDGSAVYAMDTYSAEPGALVVDATTGVGTLTLTTSDTNVGVSGVETFAIQFVNSDHALISQWDGTATSSGSFDLQTIPTSPSTSSFAFTMSGVDPGYASIAYGGVLTVNTATGSATGIVDVNDDGDVVPGTPVTGISFVAPDAFGRGTVTGFTNPTTSASVSLAYYIVGAEAIRLIDIDTATSAPWDTMVGSAYGQGSSTFTNANFLAPNGTGTFNAIGQFSWQYAALGEFATDGAGDITAGTADDNELDSTLGPITDASLTGSYNVNGTAANGYGTFTITAGDLGDISAMGLYMVDPTLDINDPNNSATSPDVGGALIIDLDAGVPGGMGVITPQTDTTQADFGSTPNYAAGFQDFNDFNPVCTGIFCEFDMVGPFTMTPTTGPFATAAIGAEDSDPFGTWDGTAATSSADTFTSTPTLVSAGYYTGTPLAASINTAAGDMSVDFYQASGDTLYWIEVDDTGVFLGPIEVQGSLSSMPAAKRPGKAQTRQNRKPANAHGGPIR
jgi:hypothetical protein